MLTIFVTDIFGRTPELETCFSGFNLPYQIVDPYGGEYHSFDDETAAYHYFMQHVGIEKYSELLFEAIAQCHVPVSVVGFSAGASALWHVAARSKAPHLASGIGFYGSQIRHALELTPQIPLKLVFPIKESHFDVNDVMQSLANHNHVEVCQSQYLHGFMNPLSVNYHAQGCVDTLSKLELLLK
ncbi:hypothetical protein [Shewanella waksmanii]|uniref:hypothetical protein n=1 Tax=Shewanella waksmanii TaxID=213783 RepID=UPI003734DB2A